MVTLHIVSFKKIKKLEMKFNASDNVEYKFFFSRGQNVKNPYPLRSASPLNALWMMEGACMVVNRAFLWSSPRLFFAPLPCFRFLCLSFHWFLEDLYNFTLKKWFFFSSINLNHGWKEPMLLFSRINKDIIWFHKI